MIIKNFLNKINFSYYTLFLILICFVTGLIKEISAVLILIIFHEFGHYLVSYIYKWNILKINIFPFGGVIVYDDIIDKPFKEELLVTLGGPINQIIIFNIYYLLHKYFYISDSYFIILKNYHYCMLFFNLLPIIPLDGSKLLNVILNKFLNFRTSYNLLLIISSLFIVGFILLFSNNYSYFIVISFLIYELINYFKNKKYIFNRFILEKYLYRNNYKKYNRINNINNMKRNKKHLIKYKNIYITEKEYIKKIKGV